MRFRFADPVLIQMYTDASFEGGYGRDVARAFRRMMERINAAIDEREFYQMKSMHFEKLKGDRSHQRSMRLNQQWRLILEIEESDPKNVIVVISIEDYH